MGLKKKKILLHYTIYINETAPFETFTKEKPLPHDQVKFRFSYKTRYSALEGYNFIFTLNSLKVENKAVF